MYLIFRVIVSQIFERAFRKFEFEIFHCYWTINTLNTQKVNYKDKNCTYYPSNIDGGKIIGKKLKLCQTQTNIAIWEATNWQPERQTKKFVSTMKYTCNIIIFCFRRWFKNKKEFPYFYKLTNIAIIICIPYKIEL